MLTRNHGPLYGRERELARIELGMDQVVAGRGECLLVTGELGVGTSALADRACEIATARGMTVLRGRAWPLHGGVAYGPIMAAVGAALRAVEPSRRVALTEGLDDLGRLFPWLALRPLAASHDGLGTGRLWEAFVALLDRLTREAPALLCIDDVHAADDATLELLQYLIHAVPNMRLWVVLTLHGSAASHKLRLLVTLLEQAELASTVAPSPLDREHTRALIEARVGMRAADDLVTLIDERARGLPLFIHSILQQLHEDRGLLPVDDTVYAAKHAEARLPAGLRPLIDASLASLSPDARGVAELMAVAGGSLARQILVAACGLAPDALSDALAELRARRVLGERSDERGPDLDLAQPLAQQAIYDGLAEVTRRRMHERLIRALEADRRPDVARLAHHYRSLGTETENPQRSISVLAAAAEEANARLAHRERAHWLTAAATLLRGVGPDDALIRTLIELGHAWRRAGEARAAFEVWREALALSPTGVGVAGELDAVWSHAALAAWDARGHDECERMFARGVEALEPRGPSHALARLYLAKLTVRARSGDRAAVEVLAERMAHPSFRAQSGESAFQIHLARFHVEEMRGDYQRANAALQDASEAARDPEQRIRARYLIAGATLMLRGDHRGVEPVLDGLEALLAEHDLVAFRPIGPMYRGFAAQLQGRWNDAAHALHAALASCSRSGGSRWAAGLHATRAMLLALRGELADAADDLQRALAHTSAFTERTRVVEIARITIELEREELGAALEIAADLEPVKVVPGFEAVRVEALIRGGCVEAGEAAAHALGGSPYADAFAARLRGIAAAARGDGVAAHRELGIAIDAFEQLEIPFEAARGRLDRATPGHAAKACRIDDAERAAATFVAVGARRYAERANALLKALGVKAPVRRRDRAPRELSARELEVARLAASRLTNQEIGTRLFLSPHTVATHVKRIYERLEVSSRKDLARRLAELGLATETE